MKRISYAFFSSFSASEMNRGRDIFKELNIFCCGGGEGGGLCGYLGPLFQIHPGSSQLPTLIVDEWRVKASESYKREREKEAPKRPTTRQVPSPYWVASQLSSEKATHYFLPTLKSFLNPMKCT